MKTDSVLRRDPRHEVRKIMRTFALPSVFNHDNAELQPSRTHPTVPLIMARNHGHRIDCLPRTDLCGRHLDHHAAALLACGSFVSRSLRVDPIHALFSRCNSLEVIGLAIASAAGAASLLGMAALLMGRLNRPGHSRDFRSCFNRDT
jgi:hypothetical protein